MRVFLLHCPMDHDQIYRRYQQLQRYVGWTDDDREWMARLSELTDKDTYLEERDGLGGWFTPPGAPCPAPL